MGEPVPASVDEEWAHVSNAEGYAWLLPADEHTHDDVPPCPEEVGTVLPPADDDAHGVPPWIREAEASLQSPNVYSSDEPGGHREKTSPPLQSQHAHKPGSRLPASLVIVAMMALLVGGLELHMLSRVSAVGDACSGLVDSVRLECGSVSASSVTEGKQSPTSLWRAMIRQVAEARGEAEEARKALHEKTDALRAAESGLKQELSDAQRLLLSNAQRHRQALAEVQELRIALKQVKGERLEVSLKAAAATRSAEASEQARRDERTSWKWRIDEQARLLERQREELEASRQQIQLLQRKSTTQDPKHKTNGGEPRDRQSRGRPRPRGLASGWWEEMLWDLPSVSCPFSRV